VGQDAQASRYPRAKRGLSLRKKAAEAIGGKNVTNNIFHLKAKNSTRQFVLWLMGGKASVGSRGIP